MIGQRIAQYEILEQLGMGGMGIVYKAKDTNLGRIVALKFLPQNTLVTDDDRARFRREAQAAASLNHPNICTIYDLGETKDGQAYIAMEYVEGPTLRHEIEKGPMKLERAISIAVQIAKGLQAAHSVNIVHRDVKSANIMLNAGGQVKIMDFGLAKTAQSTHLTKTGSTLGTFTFMSPEQARGDAVDHRTDIWSLGVVLYELVTGRLPFGGEYEQAMVYAILNQDPEPLTALRTGIPVALDWIMAKLLSKDPARRYQSASEAAIDLESIDLKATGLSSVSMISSMSGVSQMSQPAASAAAPASAEAPAPSVARATVPWARLVPIAVGLAIVAAALGWLLKPAPSEVVRPVLRFEKLLPEGISISNTGRHSVAISPDGQYFAFVANTQVYLGRLDSQDPALPVRGSDGCREVFFSPNSRWLAFEESSKRLLKVAVAGGSPIPITNLTTSVYGSSWSDDGWIYYGQGRDGIFRAPENGGSSEPVVRADSSAANVLFNQPQLLPGGDRLLYSRKDGSSESWDDATIEVLDLSSGNRTALPLRGNDARYLVSGHLVYGFGGTLYAASFDPKTLRLGMSVPLIEGILQGGNGAAGPMQSSASDAGILAWIPGVRTDDSGWLMTWVTQSGAEQAIFADRGFFIQPRLSPDGTRIAVVKYDGGVNQVWIYDVARGAPALLAATLSDQAGPVWSPDGREIAFSGAVDPSSNSPIWLANADLGSEPRMIISADYDIEAESWSPDGRHIAYTQTGASGDIFIYDIEEDSSSTFLATSADEFMSAFSADGKWLAYTSDVTGNFEVYIRPFPGPGGEYIVSAGGGSSPMWSSDGTRIYYYDQSSRSVLAVDADLSSTPRFSAPERIYQGQTFAPGGYQGASWGYMDFDRRNERFIMMNGGNNAPTSADQADEDVLARRSRINFVVDWFEELKWLVPPLK